MQRGTSDVSADLMVQFLTWVARPPRTSDDTMEAWRIICPSISSWEDALLGGLIALEDGKQTGQASVAVILTQPGSDRLRESGLVSLG